MAPKNRRDDVRAAVGKKRSSRRLSNKLRTPIISLTPEGMDQTTTTVSEPDLKGQRNLTQVTHKTTGHKIRRPLQLKDFIRKTKSKSDKQLSSNKGCITKPSNKGSYCLPTCKYKGHNHGEAMIRCCLCMTWVHPTSCCGDTKEDAKHLGFYTCSHCRNLSNRLTNIENLFENLQNVNKDLIRQLEDKEQECKTLRLLLQEGNSKCAVNDVKSEISYADAVKKTQSSNRPTPAPRKHKKPKITMLGSSMVRNTGPMLSSKFTNKNTMVYSVSGLSIDGATQMVSTTFSDFQNSDVAVLQVGTNDLESNSSEKLSQIYDHLIDTVKMTAPDSKVIVTAVPHRLPTPDSYSLNQKASRLNTHLQSRCSKDENVTFVDCNPQLTESFYNRFDGVHFNFRGSSYFASCLSEYIKCTQNFARVGATLLI